MRGRIAAGAVIVIVVSAGAVPAASATKTVSPTSHDFGALPIGTKSAERTFTLTATCNPSSDMTIPCQTFESWQVQPSTVGDFAIEGDNCPDPFLIGDTTMFSRSCTVRVTFTPTAFGPRSGTLVTGGGGPSVPLTGSGPTLVVTQTVPGPALAPLPAPAPTKKCKKPKRSASAAARKCKRKKKGG